MNTISTGETKSSHMRELPIQPASGRQFERLPRKRDAFASDHTKDFHSEPQRRRGRHRPGLLRPNYSLVPWHESQGQSRRHRQAEHARTTPSLQFSLHQHARESQASYGQA